MTGLHTAHRSRSDLPSVPPKDGCSHRHKPPHLRPFGLGAFVLGQS